MIKIIPQPIKSFNDKYGIKDKYPKSNENTFF
jgi:hypothetical protein